MCFYLETNNILINILILFPITRFIYQQINRANAEPQQVTKIVLLFLCLNFKFIIQIVLKALWF